MELWAALYMSVEWISCVCTLAILLKLLHHRKDAVQSSAVYWLLVTFFGDLTLWAFCRALFFAMYQPHSTTSGNSSGHSQSQSQSGSEALEQQDVHVTDAVYGMRQTREYPVTDPTLIVIMLIGDAMLVATALTVLAMTRELFVLAKVTMDRGAIQEKKVIRRYLIVINGLTALFSLAQILVIVVRDNRQYDATVLWLTSVGLWLQGLDIVAVVVSLTILKCKGRHVESVHGALVTSPLYIRIRNLLIIYGVFSLQYQIFSLEFYSNSLNQVPSWVIGVSTLWFRSIGIALAFLMGCSQEWVALTFKWCLPTEYVEKFKTPEGLVENSMLQEPCGAPERDPVFVFTDIESSSALWALEDGALMRVANELHDNILRSLLLKHNGYEITTAGDAFQLVFGCIQDAVEYCMDVQLELLHAKWPKRLRQCGIEAARRQKVDGKTIFDGLRVRMGIHDAREDLEGRLVYGIHPVTNRATYTGLSEVIANQIGDLGQGGQILMTYRVAQWVEMNGRKNLTRHCHVRFVGRFAITSVNESVNVFELVLEELRARVDFFEHAAPRRLKSCVQIKTMHEENSRGFESHQNFQIGY